jgi:hypothetical protein
VENIFILNEKVFYFWLETFYFVAQICVSFYVVERIPQTLTCGAAIIRANSASADMAHKFLT